MKPKHPLLDRYVELCSDENGDETWKVTWPEDVQERGQLANLLLGNELVNDVDYWAMFVRDFIQNPEPEAGHSLDTDDGRQCAAYRQAFAGLSDEQKQAATHLIEKALSALLVSICTSFDSERVAIKRTVNAQANETIHDPQEIEIDVPPINHKCYSFDAEGWLELFSQLNHNKQKLSE